MSTKSRQVAHVLQQRVSGCLSSAIKPIDSSNAIQVDKEVK